MTDPIHEQLSAFHDGELPAAETELLLKRLDRDPQLRATLGRYSLIGAALNATQAGGPSRDFATRVARAIEQESMPARVWRPVAHWLKPMAGGAIAAGVAAVALVTLRLAPVDVPVANFAVTNSPTTTTPAVTSTIMEKQRSAQIESVARVRERLPSDTVPVSNVNFTAPPIQVSNSGRLANFVVAHSEYSLPLGRRNLLTNLLAEEPSSDADSTEADSNGEQPTR